MHDRLKELLGQAYDEAVPETWTTLSSEQLGRIYEKFAELIVQECSKALWTQECHTSDLAVEEYNRNIKKILEHFGIEE